MLLQVSQKILQVTFAVRHTAPFSLWSKTVVKNRKSRKKHDPDLVLQNLQSHPISSVAGMRNWCQDKGRLVFAISNTQPPHYGISACFAVADLVGGVYTPSFFTYQGTKISENSKRKGIREIHCSLMQNIHLQEYLSFFSRGHASRNSQKVAH